ncbi:MAG: hypothetical protein K2P95_04525 [Hyphomonadaceae bacterium]|nr:hypothetical protein [Hyphomonadaceae bacterium]
MGHDSLKPLPAGLIRVSAEQAPVRMRVLYETDGPQCLTGEETRLSSGGFSTAVQVGYTVEPAIYRIRMRDDRPLEPAEEAPEQESAPLRRAGPRAVAPT